MKPVHYIIGAALVAAGALSALWLPPGLIGVILLLALIRICWLEDNIISDLFGRDQLPAGYRSTAELRRNFLLRWFGIWAEETTAEQSAHLMATAMRAEVQIWAALVLGIGSALVGQSGPFAPLVDLGMGACIFVIALTRADRLAVSLAYGEAGRALPDHLLLPSGRRGLADRGR